VTSEFQSDVLRLERLLSGGSELGRSRAAWEEADRLARRITARRGMVSFPKEIRNWLLDEPPSDKELVRLAVSPLRMQALLRKVRRWVEASIVVMRERQGG
jgi:hypothetical protein